jgi:outer membrane lipoprotein-sorting protein
VAISDCGAAEWLYVVQPGSVLFEDNIMRRLISLCMFLAAVLLWNDLLTASTVQDILRQADQARGNLEGVSWEVVLESLENTRTETMTWDVKARGFDIRGENLAPPKSKGNKILMLYGNMWFYKPGLSKAVPISQRQRLLGNAAYGDIAATNYANDYAATVLADDTVNGEICYVFDLLTKDKKTTYDRIKYWISKDRVVGIKAEYFTVSGKQFKAATMTYANTVNVNGEARRFISQIIIHDELMTNNVTTLTFNRPEIQLLPSYTFDLNLLVK